MRLYFSNRFCNQGDTPESYFLIYWQDYVERLIDKNETEVSMDSPRLILQELSSEIQYNGLRNKENAEYYKAALGRWLKEDKVFCKLCSGLACFALKNFSAQNSKALLLLCQNMIEAIDANEYFEKVCEECKSYIEAQADLNVDNKLNIRRYVRVLVYEMISADLALKDILQCGKEGISGILKFFNSPPEDAIAIVRLIGLRGKLDEHLGDVHIYSPKIHRYIIDTEMSFTKIEECPNDQEFVNAAVPIRLKGVETARLQVKKKLFKLLELLALQFSTKTQLSFDNSNFAVVVDGRERGASFSIDPGNGIKTPQMALLENSHSLDADEVVGSKDFLVERFSKTYCSNDEVSIRLQNAVHWCYEAEYNSKFEEQLLHSWYAMEGLLKVSNETKGNLFLNTDDGVIKVIQKVLSSAMGLWRQRILWKGAYISLREAIILENNGFGISDDLIRKSSLETPPGKSIDAESFKACLTELEQSVSHELLKDRLHACSLYYSDKDQLKKYIKEVENDILMIYRTRNLIAHNAVIPEGTISIYARKARSMARFITCYIIDRCGNGKTIDDILIELTLTCNLKLSVTK